MRKIKPKEIKNRYSLHGFFLGLVIFIITVLVTINSDQFAKEGHSFLDLFIIFPGLWVVLFVPVFTLIIGYYWASGFTQNLKRQAKKIKEEATRSRLVLDFIEDLRNGNFNSKVSFEDSKDQLGRSLLRLRDYLVNNKKEEEQRRIEEQQRNWVTQGFAQFGEILRQNSDNLEELSYNIVKYLVNYMKINQGGVYLLNKDDFGKRTFELTASIAFDRKKFVDKSISWGEGLIGRCGQEMETIYLTDVPNDYITVTSGLGEANPRAILIVPLKVNNEIFGVIELAAFIEFQKFEIEFVEKTAESIASTISSAQISIQTNDLLRETQIQAEKMSQQEEELRQNLEEMQATQEESDRREVEMKGILEAIDHAAISCEFETDGTLISINKNFLKTFKYQHEEIENQNLRIFSFKEDLDEMERILLDLKSGQNFKGRARRRTKLGEAVWLLITYTPVIDHEGEIVKILSMEFDISEQVKMEEELKRSQEELENLLEQAKADVKEQFKEIEYVKIRNEKTLEGVLDAIVTINKNGIVDFFNAAAEKLWGYSREEVMNNHIEMLFSKETIATDQFVNAFITSESDKIVGERKEVAIKNKYGDEVSVLILLSEAKVGDDHSVTAFIQNIEVELF